MSKYAEMIDLLEHADGPDADIDWLVSRALYQKDPVPAYTASMDVCVPLVHKMLPKVQWHMAQNDGFVVTIWPTDEQGNTIIQPETFEVRAATPPIAILLALFRGLDAKERRA